MHARRAHAHAPRQPVYVAATGSRRIRQPRRTGPSTQPQPTQSDTSLLESNQQSWDSQGEEDAAWSQAPLQTDLQLQRQRSGSEASSSGALHGAGGGLNEGSESTGQTAALSLSWLFTNRAASIASLETRRQYASLLASSTQHLFAYDIRSPQGRSPNLRKNPQVIQPCLTARSMALEAARRRPRLQAREEEELEQQPSALVPGAEESRKAAAASVLPTEDPAWQQKQRAQQPYLLYMQQLHGHLMVQQTRETAVRWKVEQAAAAAAGTLEQGRGKRQRKTPREQQQDEQPPLLPVIEQQLLYQIGIADDWLQCRYIADVFGSALGPGPAVAVLKRLGDLLADPRVRQRMSPVEGIVFQQFCGQLAARMLSWVHLLTAQQVGQVAYALACMELSSCSALLEAVVKQAGSLLDTQLAAAAASKSSSRSGGGGRGSDDGSGSGSARSAQATEVTASFVAADYASLVWALATLEHRPAAAWLDALCMCSLPRLDAFQASQLWGLLWGLSKLGHVPRRVWMTRFLMCAERIMPEFTIEGLCRMIWALGAMGYVPEKTWLRTFIGQVRSKYRSLLPGLMTELMEGLAAVGYKPREQICWSLQAQARRYLHAFTPAQQSTLMRAMATLSKWQPQRQFLYDFVTHSQPKLQAMTAFQLSGVIWAFARFKYIPDKSYTKPLLAQLQHRMITAQPSGPALSQALWGVAALGLGHPGTEWMDAWSLRARQGMQSFSPQCLAYSIWALADLCAAPAPPPDAELLEGLLLRFEQELPSLTCMELTTVVSSLAELRYRPSEAWLAAYTEHMRERIPSLQNQDFGLLIWGLASLAAPVDEAWLNALVREAGRKWWSMDLEGMALLLWGLAQYDVQLDKREWWEGFWRESDLRWDSASQETLGMLLLALAHLLDSAPTRPWQRNLIRAIRLTFPKPTSSAAVVPMLEEAAGLGPGETFPKTPWLRAFFSELRTQWGYARTLA